MGRDTTGREPGRAADQAGRSCPVCRRDIETRRVGEKDEFAWRRCVACDTTFIDRSPTQEELDSLYGSYYSSGNLEVPDFVSGRLREIIAPFVRYRRTGRLLDVGYGAGTLLTVAEGAGWECWGQEVAPQSIRLGEGRGWRVVQGDFCDVDLPESHFDVICITGVLEHVMYPTSYLQRAFQLLRPGGLLYATTPNGLSVTGRLLGVEWSVYSAPEHMQLLTASSLRDACLRAGFVRVRVLSEGVNPYELGSRLKKGGTPVDRVQTAYALNRRMSSGVLPRLAKRGINRVLTLTGLGEELKCFAERPADRPAPASPDRSG